MKALYRRTAYRGLFLCSLVLVTFVSGADTQEFFPKHFVQEQAPKKSLPQSSQKKAAPQIQERTPLAAVIPLDKKVQAVVYVNSADREHFDRVVTAVLAVQRKRKIHVHSIMHVGDYRNITEKQVLELTNLGIVVQSLDRLPEKFPATKSPAWGLMTSESRPQRLAYIIEGYMEPEIFFNQANQFEIPAGMQVGKDEEQQGKLAEF